MHPDAVSLAWRPVTLLRAAVVRTTGDLGDLIAPIDRVAEVWVILPHVFQIAPRVVPIRPDSRVYVLEGARDSRKRGQSKQTMHFLLFILILPIYPLLPC